MHLDDDVPARRCLDKGVSYESIVDPPGSRKGSSRLVSSRKGVSLWVRPDFCNARLLLSSITTVFIRLLVKPDTLDLVSLNKL